MGQTTTALILGIKATKALNRKLWNERGAIWDDYDKPESERLPYEMHPEEGEDQGCLGYPVAVAFCGDRGEAEFGGVTYALSDIEKVFAKPIKEARKKWDKLAAYLGAREIKLPEPFLLLTTVERA